MKKFTLDDIRAAADKKYGSMFVDINGEECELVNALRLPKEKRKALTSLQKKADAEPQEGEEAVDQEEVLADSLKLICRTEGQAHRILDAFGGDVALLAALFAEYSEETEAGEASGSQS